MRRGLFHDGVCAAVAAAGGFHNAHLHLDRVHTLDDGYVDAGRVRVLESSHISLQRKHALIATVHEGRAYDREDLLRRFHMGVEELVAAGTRLADTMVDVTDDRVNTEALSCLQAAAAEVADRITIRAAAYTPLGFRRDSPAQWEVFERGVAMADFIGSLPEADEVAHYPDNIGFDAHLDRMLDLVARTGKFLHVHTDQRNEASERGTERLIAAMRRTPGLPSDPDGAPLVWAVHMISPSTYDAARWDAFVDGLLECNIGVIICPSAALAMRQLRPLASPTGNSMPRVLELAAAGVPIRIGSDNVGDMCSPSTTLDLMDEVFVLSAALRFFEPGILGAMAAGQRLNQAQRATLDAHLRLNDEEVEKLIAKTGPHAARL